MKCLDEVKNKYYKFRKMPTVTGFYVSSRCLKVKEVQKWCKQHHLKINMGKIVFPKNKKLRRYGDISSKVDKHKRGTGRGY